MFNNFDDHINLDTDGNYAGTLGTGMVILQVLYVGAQGLHGVQQVYDSFFAWLIELDGSAEYATDEVVNGSYVFE